METDANMGELQGPKEFYRVEFSDIQAPTLIEAHEALGRQLKDTINLLALSKFNELSDNGIDHLTFARECNQYLVGMDKPLVSEYLACLRAWANGAELDKMARDLSIRTGLELEAIDIALWLQDDNVGCMSSIVKVDGGYAVCHYEESPINHLDKPRVVKFSIGDGEKKQDTWSFVYGHLLPGAGFSFTQNSAMMVDFLFLDKAKEPAALANMFAWVLSFHPDENPEQIFEEMQPFIDGYAVNRVYVNDKGVVQAERILFGKDKFERKELSPEDLPHIQGNVVPDESSLKSLELVGEKHAKYKGRERMWKTAMKFIRTSDHSKIMEYFTRFLTMGSGIYRVKDKAFVNANPDIGAGFVAILTAGGVKIARVLDGYPQQDEIRRHKGYTEVINREGVVDK